MKTRSGVTAAIGACLLLSACTQEQELDQCLTPASTDAATLAAMYDEVHALIEDRSCAVTADCDAIGLGAKACGGPWNYAVYSKATVDESELVSRADELVEYEKRYNAEHCRISDCSLPPAPRPECVNQVCVDASQTP